MAPAHEGTPAGVYPRVCGGNQTATVITAWIEGLSPRVRGKLLSGGGGGGGGCCRSIPACAGETERSVRTAR